MTDDRVAAFQADIAGSPEALARLLDAWRPVDLGERRAFSIVGLGSSRFAAMVVVARLQSMGVAAWSESASFGGGSAPAGDRVLVAVSASGRTPEVLDVVDRHRGRTLVVAVTNRESSPLAGAADHVLPLHAGEERGGIACRTFRATISALALLTGLASPDDLRPAIDRLASRLAAAASWVPAHADALDGAPAIDVFAPAPLLGVAEQAALMLREAPRLPAHAFETGEWLHTGVYLALPGHRAILFPGSASDGEVDDTIRRRGGEVLNFPAGDPTGDPAADADAVTRAIVDSVAAESLAAALWGRARALDRDSIR